MNEEDSKGVGLLSSQLAEAKENYLRKSKGQWSANAWSLQRRRTKQLIFFLFLLLKCPEFQFYLNVHRNRHLWAQSRHCNGPALQSFSRTF